MRAAPVLGSDSTRRITRKPNRLVLSFISCVVMVDSSSNPHSALRNPQSFDPYFSLSGAVEFAEIDGLPGAELQAAIFDNDLGGIAHHAGFDVCGGVAFVVGVTGFPWYAAIERLFHVAGHVRIGVFVDGDAGGGVRDEDGNDSVCGAQFGDCGLNQRGDVHEFAFSGCRNVDLFHHVYPYRDSRFVKSPQALGGRTSYSSGFYSALTVLPHFSAISSPGIVSRSLSSFRFHNVS